MAHAGDIVSFYASVVGDLPYPSLTVAAVESQIPGGHAPVLAILNQPLPTTPFVWRDDPSAFDDYRISSWRTKWRTSGGARRSAGKTITSSG
jgi:hypothetical protein